MPFPIDVREIALVKSKRCCCLCQKFCGRNAEVHHIIQEADGGENKLENAIVLCFDCHAEVGHYNPHHPIGTKYRPSELRKHRDSWWKYCENLDPSLRPPSMKFPDERHNYLEFIPNGKDLQIFEKEIGTLWSNWLNMPPQSEIIKFEARYVGKADTVDNNGPTSYELYQLPNGEYLVYSIHNHRGDWCTANLAGINAWGEIDPPLTIERVQEEFPILAKALGLVRVREFRVNREE